MTAGWPKSWTQATEASSPPLPCPWDVHSATAHTVKAIFKDAGLRESKALLRPSGLSMWLNLSSGLYINFSDSGRWPQRSSVLWLLKTGLICKFPCLLNLLPPNLECPALSFVSPCPPCMEAILWIHTRVTSHWVENPIYVWGDS